MNAIVKNLKQLLTVLAIAFLTMGCANAYLPPLSYHPWQLVSLDTDAALSDISFSSPTHGWLVGSSSTILESKDAGKTWQRKELGLGDQKFRLNSVSFAGKEGWIVGQPSLLLHTTDDGKSWSEIPLSEKLPGSPNTVTALGPRSAEMTTDIGAIYRTEDNGHTWQALVEEAVGVVRNIERSPEGKYIAVSAKGNFYSTWEPGQRAWTPHNRNSSRRVQNMGFGQDGRIWMLARGGQLQFTEGEDFETWSKPSSPEFATSWGLLALAYRTPEELWVSGGSGNLLCSFDGGKTWQKDQAVEDVPSNLNKIVFLSPNRGFIIGQRGTLLRYEPQAATTAA